jgi:hypothetical protein
MSTNGVLSVVSSICASQSYLAQIANWLKRTDRLLCREAETSVKKRDTFIFG